jgi:hypothetical protein
MIGEGRPGEPCIRLCITLYVSWVVDWVADYFHVWKVETVFPMELYTLW